MEPQWKRLGELVRTWRMGHGWTQELVYERGGPSDTLQGRIEAGKWKPTRGVDETLAKIDVGLGWEIGSASRVLTGADPTPLPDAEAPRGAWPRDAAGSSESYDIIFGRAVQRNRESRGLPISEAAQLTGISIDRLRGIESGTARALEPTEVVSIALALEWDTFEALTLAGYNGYGQGAIDTPEPASSSTPPPQSIAVDLVYAMHELFKSFITTDADTRARVEAEFMELAGEANLLQRMSFGLNSTPEGALAVAREERDLINRARNLLMPFARPEPAPSPSQHSTADVPQHDPLGEKLSGRDEGGDSGHH